MQKKPLPPKAPVYLTSVEGNHQWLDGGAMFGNAPRELWQKWHQPDPRGRIKLSCRSLLIEHQDTKILCEVGIGDMFEPKLAERFGVDQADTPLLVNNLKSLGIHEEDIDYVVLSHLHFDHAGGLLPNWKVRSNPKRKDFALRFPKATYITSAQAFERAQSPHPRDRASYIPELAEKLIESKRLRLIEPSKQDWQTSFHIGTLPVSCFFSHGHTPGQMHLTLYQPDRSGYEPDQATQTICIFAGDLVPGTAWMHAPITMGYDRFAEQVIDEKLQMYERTAQNATYLFFTHDTATCLAQVAKDPKGRFLADKTFSSLRKWEL